MYSVPDPLKGTKGTGLRPRASGGLAPQGALTGLLRFFRGGKRKNGEGRKKDRKEKKKRENGEKKMTKTRKGEEGKEKEGGGGMMEGKKEIISHQKYLRTKQ